MLAPFPRCDRVLAPLAACRAGTGLKALYAAALCVVLPLGAEAQVTRLSAEPAVLDLVVGEEGTVQVRAFDARGRQVETDVRLSAARRALSVRDGTIRALMAGEFELIATNVIPWGEAGTPVSLRIPVRVGWPAVARVEVEEPGALYVGTTVRGVARAFHADGSEREESAVTWESSNPGVATVDRFGHIRARGPGSVEITASVDGVQGAVRTEVHPFPGQSLRLEGGVTEVRTGDVLVFRATVLDGAGEALPDVPVLWSHVAQPSDSMTAPSGPAQIVDGRFVADVPGLHTVVASAGPLREEVRFEVVPRRAVRGLDVVGQGREARVFTTDFWIWEGVDGRDYALTGSKHGDGISFVWDVTDPGSIVKTDSIQVDARTVNDVKVSPDGRWGALSREGASDRRNGVVILDLRSPAHPTVASTYDDGLTGGVHNMFATETHLFALSNGDKYVILDVTDLENPTYVSEYDHPDSRVHDVWVHDGLAYSAEWASGVVVVDVGNGRWGGSIESPVFVTAFPLPTGATHAVFPYLQESTGRFYLFVGDEIVNRDGLAWAGTGPDHRLQYDPATGRGGYPRATSGYIQVVDFTDPEHPQMVARYQVSEFGTHNLWVEDDILYQAYYEGGVRMVDVSGELRGNLYTQGREIAVFKAFDPRGYIPNAAAAWSVMPHKGHVFFSDINSGLWAVKLRPATRPVS